jgi:hypothetical protein
MLPDTDTLRSDIFMAIVKKMPRAAFDSACAYYNTQLPPLLARPACQCTYEGEAGAYKVTVKHQGFVTVHYLNCRDCTQATFSTIQDEQHEHLNAPKVIGVTAGSIVNVTSRP